MRAPSIVHRDVESELQEDGLNVFSLLGKTGSRPVPQDVAELVQSILQDAHGLALPLDHLAKVCCHDDDASGIHRDTCAGHVSHHMLEVVVALSVQLALSQQQLSTRDHSCPKTFLPTLLDPSCQVVALDNVECCLELSWGNPYLFESGVANCHNGFENLAESADADVRLAGLANSNVKTNPAVILNQIYKPPLLNPTRRS